MAIAQIGTAQFDTLAAAASAMKDGDTVQVLRSGQGTDAPATYNKSGKFKITGTKQSDGGIPKLVIDQWTKPGGGKGIINIEAGDHEISYLHLEGCAVPDENGAGIRFNNNGADSNVFLHHMRIVKNQDGILTGGGTLTLREEDGVYDGNGLATSESRKGQSHNAYIGAMAKYTAKRMSYLNSVYGHDFKSRAKINEFDACLFSGSAKGRAMDIPNGGIVHATDCEFRKPADATQNNLIDIGAEGITDGRPEEYIYTNCLFHNDIADLKRDLQFINNRSTKEVVLVDPLFSGAAAAKDQKQTLRGNVRIVLTGGPLGPRVKAGGDPGASSTLDIPAAGQVTVTPPSTGGGAVTPPSTVPATSMSLTTDPGTAGTWAKLADEGAVVTVPAGTIVRYGANGSYLYAKVAGKFTVGNQFFTKDPAPKVVKTVDIFTPVGGTTPPATGGGNNADAAALATILSNLSGKTIIITVQ